MSFSHLSRPVRQVTGKTFARKFITLGKVITFWPDIVGPDLATKTYPIGMSVRKTGAKKEAKKNKEMGQTAAGARSPASTPAPRDLEATLEIAASSADATLLHYQKAMILERLGTMLGGDMIVDLRITHAARPKPLAQPLAPSPLTPQQKTCLSQELEIVSDPDLKQALENLGRWIT